MDLPACSLYSYIHTFAHLCPTFSPVWLCLFLLIFLSPGFAFLFFLFSLLGNSTDKGSSLPPVLCSGHVRNACSLSLINSEESSHGLCANEWKLLYSNKPLFIDLNILFYVCMFYSHRVFYSCLLLPTPPLGPSTKINSTFR